MRRSAWRTAAQVRHRALVIDHGAGQRGTTIVEVLVALAIGALVIGSAAAVMAFMLRTPGTARERLISSGSAFQTNARFVDDIGSATPIGSDLAVARGQQGCGGDANSVLRVLVRSGSGVEVRSYSVASGGEVLERRVCSGPDVTAALAASPKRNQVTDDLDSGSGAVVVVCRANAGAAPAPATPTGDEQCRIVTMTVRTVSGYEFTLEGHRDSNQTPVMTPSSVKSCTLLSSGDTWVSSYDPDTNYGREWHTSTFWRRTGAYGYLFSFVRVDLLGPCTGPGEPSFLPGGKRLLSADLQLWLIRDSPPDWCGCESVHALRVVGDPWDEATVTWHTRPDVRPDSNTRFFDAGRYSGWANTPFNFNVLAEVNQWYAGPTAGGWPNYGWRLDRGDAPVPDDSGTDNGFWWGARESSDTRQWPMLTVTWE